MQKRIIRSSNRTHKESCVQQSQEKDWLANIERLVCVVCDRWVSKIGVKRYKPGENAALRWRAKLRGSNNVPNVFRKYYDVSGVVHELRGSLLSQSGLEKRGGHHTGYLIVCPECFRAMKIGNKPPKFAIVNGFDIAKLPGFLQHANCMERRLTSLTAVAVRMTVLQGGKHRAIKGHVSVMHMNPVSIARRLPKLLESDAEQFLVVFARSVTALQEEVVMKRYNARIETVRALLTFNLEYDEIYKARGVVIDEQLIDFLESKEDDWD